MCNTMVARPQGHGYVHSVKIRTESLDTVAHQPVTIACMRSATITALGAYHLIIGAAMALAPRRFFDDIAAYGAYNDHYIRDVATFYVALGAVLVVAAARTSWQIPLLVFALVQYGLHVVNHLIDIGDTEPGWLGPFNAVALALVTALLWSLLRARARAGSE